MADLIFGTHAVQTHNAEVVKSKVWGSAAGGAVRVLAAFICVGAQAYADVQPQVWRSAAAPLALPAPVAKFWSVPPQTVDLSLPSFFDAPTAAAQGRVPALVSAYPVDTSQPAARLYFPLLAPPVVPNPIAGYFKTIPQFEDRPSVLVFRAALPGSPTSIIPRVSAAPQVLDLTLQPQVYPPASSPVLVSYGLRGFFTSPLPQDLTQQPVLFRPTPARQGKPPPVISAAPQVVDLSLQAQFFQPLVAPPLPGQYVQKFVWVPSQYDFQVNRTWFSVAFTQPYVPPPTLVANPCQQVYLATRPFTCYLPARAFQVSLPSRPFTVYWIC
jgi:hypothetical protein